jgi:hypothetical protein
LLFGRSDPFGIGVCGDRSVGTGATGAGVAIVGTSGSVGSEIGGGADNTLPGEDVPPGGKRVGGASLLGLGATILDASNFGGSATAATVPWPEAKTISPGGTESKEGKGSPACGSSLIKESTAGSLFGMAIAGGRPGGRLGATLASDYKEFESTTIGLAKTAE